MNRFLLAAIATAALSGATTLAQAPSPGANPAPANTANPPGSAANPPANAPAANAVQNVPANGPNFIKVKNDVARTGRTRSELGRARVASANQGYDRSTGRARPARNGRSCPL